MTHPRLPAVQPQQDTILPHMPPGTVSRQPTAASDPKWGPGGGESKIRTEATNSVPADNLAGDERQSTAGVSSSGGRCQQIQLLADA